MKDSRHGLLFRDIKSLLSEFFDSELSKALLSAFKIMAIGVVGILLSQTIGDVTIGKQTMPSFVWMYMAVAFQAGVIARHMGAFK